MSFGNQFFPIIYGDGGGTPPAPGDSEIYVPPITADIAPTLGLNAFPLLSGQTASVISGTAGVYLAETLTVDVSSGSTWLAVEGRGNNVNASQGVGLLGNAVTVPAIYALFVGAQWSFVLANGTTPVAGVGVAGGVNDIPAFAVERGTGAVKAYLNGNQITTGPSASGGPADTFLSTSVSGITPIVLGVFNGADPLNTSLVTSGLQMAFNYDDATDFGGFVIAATGLTRSDDAQPPLQFLDNGADIGTPGSIISVNISGDGVAVSESGGQLTINIPDTSAYAPALTTSAFPVTTSGYASTITINAASVDGQKATAPVNSSPTVLYYGANAAPQPKAGTRRVIEGRAFGNSAQNEVYGGIALLGNTSNRLCAISVNVDISNTPVWQWFFGTFTSGVVSGSIGDVPAIVINNNDVEIYLNGVLIASSPTNWLLTDTNVYPCVITSSINSVSTSAALVTQASQMAYTYNATDFKGNVVTPTNLKTVAFTNSYNDLNDKPTIPAAQVNSDWNASSGVTQILNKPTIPAAQVNSDWNASAGVAQILNKPTIPAAQVNSDWNASSGVAQILNKPTIPAAQVNSDWNATAGVAQILNKPTINGRVVGNTGDAVNTTYDIVTQDGITLGVRKVSTTFYSPYLKNNTGASITLTYASQTNGATSQGKYAVNATLANGASVEFDSDNLTYWSTTITEFVNVQFTVNDNNRKLGSTMAYTVGTTVYIFGNLLRLS